MAATLATRKRLDVPRRADPLMPLATASSLAVLIDVDSLCMHLNGRVDRQFIETLRMLAATDAQIILISTRAHELAGTLSASVEGVWSCDRIHGWHDLPTRADGKLASYALVVTQIRQRLVNARIIAISNEPSLWAALDGQDRTIALRPGDETAVDLAVTSDELSDALWCVIDIRTYRRRLHQR